VQRCGSEKIPRFADLGSRCRAPGAGFRVPGAGFRVPGAGFRVPGAGFRVPGAGFRVHASPVPTCWGSRIRGFGFRV